MHFKNFILSCLMLLATCAIARAEAVTFQATVDNAQVSLDQAVQLTLTFTGVNDNLDPINLPALDGFTAKYVGPQSSTSFQFINGNSETHTEKSFVYNLFPNKIGHFQIPAITATVSGQTYTTQPIDVEVIAGSAQSSSGNQSNNATTDQNAAAPTADSLKDKVLIRVTVGKTQVHLNEPIPVSIKLMVNSVPIRDIQYPQFDKTAFSVDDFESPVQSSEVFNGINYDTVEFKTNVYPNQLGDITLGPIQIQGNILYKTGQSNPFGQDNSFFGTDVFNNLFDSYATRPVTINSQPIELHVAPLPEDNRPPDFSGGLGQFDFKVSVSPLQVKAGDPLTLKMDIKGQGNFKNLKMPVFNAPGFKIYDPSIKKVGNDKSAEQVIIPMSVGINQVPALHFTYFDTSINDYRTLTQGPFAIQVTAPSADQDFKAIGFADVSHEPTPQIVTQISLGSLFADAFKTLIKVMATLWFKISALIFLVAMTVFIIWRRFQERLENDPAFARKLKAVREARAALKPAEEYIAKGQTKDFYALISKVLKDYLANKWHQSSAALSIDEIVAQLKNAKLDELYIGQIQILLQQSDLVCFAGAHRDASQMNTDLIQVQDLIARLEKQLK